MIMLGRNLLVLGILLQHANAANFLLESCVERLHYKLEYADKDIGVLLVRGENVVALGEIVGRSFQVWICHGSADGRYRI